CFPIASPPVGRSECDNCNYAGVILESENTRSSVRGVFFRKLWITFERPRDAPIVVDRQTRPHRRRTVSSGAITTTRATSSTHGPRKRETGRPVPSNRPTVGGEVGARALLDYWS